MKTKTFQTKRRPKAGFRLLHAKTRKRKQRVAAAASGGDFTVEEPNLGVARALIVILILHLAAISAIIVHHNSTKNDLAVKETPKGVGEKSASQTKAIAPALVKIGPEDRFEWVGAGDTYERIARKHSVNVDVLRRLNNNIPIKAGDPIKLPKLEAAVVAPVRVAQQQDPIITDSLPPIVDVPVSNSLPVEYEVVSQPQPVKVAPEPFAISEPVPQAQPIAIRQVSAPLPVAEPVVVETVEEVAPPAPTTKNYTVRKGDTLWAIANRNGTTTEKLMSVNGNFNPRKMRIGMSLKIPTR